MQNFISPNQIQELKTQLEMDGIHKIVVGAVIQPQSGKVLLVERAMDDFMGGLVEIPSGTVDVGEDYLNALVREVKEETNLNVNGIMAYLGHFDYLSGSGKRSRQLNFLVTVEEGEIKLNPEEHSQYYEVDLIGGEIDKLNISEKMRNILAYVR